MCALSRPGHITAGPPLWCTLLFRLRLGARAVRTTSNKPWRVSQSAEALSAVLDATPGPRDMPLLLLGLLWERLVGASSGSDV